MGQRASDTRGITFEDVEVPAEVIHSSRYERVSGKYLSFLHENRLWVLIRSASMTVRTHNVFMEKHKKNINTF